MTFRADRIDGRETQVVARPLLGGLDTKTPPHHVAPGSSPDLLNVTFDGRSVARRGGFVPMVRARPGVGSLRNVGYRVESRSQRTTGAAQTTFLTVPGCAHAGHRPVWDDADVRNGLALDLFLTIDDLTLLHGGNANGAFPPYGPSPYEIRVRPILSKGPIKRFLSEAGQMPGTTGWQTTNRWGPINNTEYAMPFCLYLWRAGGSPTWEIRFSFHVRRADNWELVTVSSNLSAIGGVRTGVKYHIVAGYDIAAETAVMRVGSWFDWQNPTYVNASAVVTAGSAAPARATPTPVQLFDCPQEFIESAAAAHATRPPGLELSSQASGGYWFASTRFQGSVEDIVIYRGLPASISAGSLDRLARIDPASPPATRLQHWPIQGLKENLVEEVSGIGNDLILNPSDPVFDEDGGIDGGSLFFNGTTSYALAEMADVNPIAGTLDDGRAGRGNWRTLFYTDGPPIVQLAGAWEYSVRNSQPHGLEVAFWAESIEPNNEQVVAEAITAARVVITHDGFIKGYMRDGAAAPTGYALVGVSAARVVPGQRYHVVVMRINTTTAQLWVNGTMEVQNAAMAAPSGSASPVSGLLIGAGAKSVTTGAQVTIIQAMPTADQVNVDHRTMFFGRMEYVRVLVGSLPFRDTVGSQAVISNRRRRAENYQLPLHRHFDELIGFVQVTSFDPVPNFGAGHVVTQPQEKRGPAVVTGNSGIIGGAYTVHAQVSETQGGAKATQQQTLTIWRTIACYDFNQQVPEFGYTGNYQPRVEYTSAGVPITARLTHVHRGYAEDEFGMGGPVQLRCVESDLLSYDPTATTDPANHTALRPYESASPRELAPQWSPGFLRPPVDTNPISFLADWRHETSGEQFLIAGCRRSVFWVKPMWRRASPFDDDGAAMWMLGQPNEYARSSLAATGTSWAAATDVIELWVYPTRLDGNRVLVMRGSSLDTSVRYLLLLREGQLHVIGSVTGGNSWAFVHGQVLAGPTRNLAGVSVKMNRWSHVVVRIGDSTVMAWVEGQKLEMNNASLVYGSAASMAGTIVTADDIWVGGVSQDQETSLFPTGSGATSFTLTLTPFHGYITAVRESGDLAAFSFTTTTSGTPPSARPVDTASTRWCFPLNQTYGWSVEDLTGDANDLDANASELVGIRHDLQDMDRSAASTVVFRNRMLVAHENIAPQAIRFIAFDSEPIFVSERLGVVQPGTQDYGYQEPLIVKTAGIDVFLGGEDLSFYVSFVSIANQEESAPFFVGQHRLSAGACATVGFGNVPRSPDPQVSARRIYLSVGGALPVYVGQLDDNTSTYFDIQTRVGLGLITPDPLSRLPAPRAKRIGLAPGVVVLANLEGNPNAFAISGESAGYFPLDRQILVDSQDGRGIVGVATHLNSVFLFKRNGTWAVSGLGVRPVNAGAGCGGGVATYDNMIFGAGDRGVWMFDGGNFQYASDALERAFQSLDVTEPGLLAQQGTYFYPGSQYWLSVRQLGATFNQSVYVLHTAVGQAPAWTLLDLPKHLALSLATDPLSDRPVLALGTSCGQILKLDQESASEGLPTAAINVGVGAGSGRTLTTVSTGYWRDMRGVTIHIYQEDGTLVAKSRITHNFEIVGPLTKFHVEHDLPSEDLNFVIGGFDAYWTSPWLGPQQFGSFVKVEHLDLEFEPKTGSMELSHALAITHATTGATHVPERAYDPVALAAASQSVVMTMGFLEQPVSLKERQQGRYFRFRLGSFVSPTALPDLFAVTGYAIRLSSTGTKGGPT